MGRQSLESNINKNIYIILRFKVTRIWLLNPKHHNEKINLNNLYTLINAKKAKMDDYLSTKRKVTRSKGEYTLLQQSYQHNNDNGQYKSCLRS